MALRLEDKKALVAEVNQVAASSESAVAAEYRGLSVAQGNRVGGACDARPGSGGAAVSPRRAREGQASEYRANGSLTRHQPPRVRRRGQDAPDSNLAPSLPTRARQRDPAAMSADERLRELGALLARGVARLRLRRKALDDGAGPEALSDAVVDAKERTTP